MLARRRRRSLLESGFSQPLPNGRGSVSSLIALALVLAGSLHAEVKVLRNFTLIDGTGRPPVAGSSMIIDNGRISWVGATSQLKVPAGAETVDLTGKFVTPGIINLHGHVGNTIDLVQDGKNFTRKNIDANLHTYALYGVTTVLSMGTDQDLIFQVRSEQRAGRPSVARVYTAGFGFVYTGGYGGLAGTTPSYSKVEEIEPAVQKLAMQKVDFVKFWLDDELGKFPKMPPAMSKAIIDSAHKRNLRVLAHVFYLEDAKRVVDQGVNGLVHLVRDKPVDQALIDGMKKQGTWQVAATLSREASMFAYAHTPAFASDPFFKRGVSQATLNLLASPDRQKTIASDPHFQQYPAILETAKKNIKRLADAGVKFGFGTDTGPPGRFPGYGEHWEMELLVESGLTPMQALTSATRDAAEFLGAKDLGTLEVAKWADLVVLNANPLADIRNTRSISSVYIAGNPVK
ncbi:MAG: amidohydrolase [Terriglobia bacterium]|nr:MAG: amidohydrolase [Terriglobia bacterium]